MTDFSKIDQRSQEVYSAAIASGANEHERVLWHDAARQYYRFKEIAEFIPDIARPQLSVLDVGCGNGEFLKYLNFCGFRGAYSGIDSHAGMVEEVARRFPGVSVSRKDILNDKIDAADVVVMSGIFNVDCGQSADYVRAVVTAAFGIARDLVIFNAISTHVSRRDEGHFYLDPADAISIAGGLSGRFALRHGFVPYNYTVAVYKVAGWDSLPW